MSAGMRLLMAMVDDVSGETMGAFIDRAVALGARNVQVVPSLTKKNRPAYLVYLDVPAALESAAGRLLGVELGCWGYRVMAAEHHHFDVARHAVQVTVRHRAVMQRHTVHVKTIADGADRLRIKAEHDDLVTLCTALRELGTELPLATLKAAVEGRLAGAEAIPAVLDLEL